VGLTDDQAQAVRVDVALLRKLADPDPNFGKPTGTRCEACDKEEHVGDEGWESGEGLSWCPDCFEEEDCDDLCTCNHARFHHDDGREMGVYTNCKAGGCACQKFVHHVPTKGEEGR
jgi:hypothetical protein